MQPNNTVVTPPTPAPSPVFSSPPSQNEERKREGIKSILSTVAILLIAPILALAITAYVFQSYEVDGPSMEPTLQNQDRLIIWKANRSWAKLVKEDYIPSRGTIVVFIMRGMYDFSNEKEKQLIKRVIGVPGDRVVVRDGIMTVYNDANPEGFIPDKTLGYGDEITEPTEGNVDITVGAGEIFVAGDNRDNSLDSRSFGAIPVQDIVGTLVLRLLPLSNAERF